ncbi:MAG: hypothetical protein QM499_09180 [Flavobacteriaceae bacterium]
MTKKDTIQIKVNLTMEHWVRIDELILTKRKNKLNLQTTIKEDTTFMSKYEMRENTLAELNFENIDNEFEHHFLTNFRRTKIDSSENWIYRIISQKDTLKFYTVGLGDKSGCVKEYFDFMGNYSRGVIPDITITENINDFILNRDLIKETTLNLILTE